MTAAVILVTCAMVARMSYRRYGDDYPGDEYARWKRRRSSVSTRC